MAPKTAKTLLVATLLKAYTMFLSKWSFKTYFGENRVWVGLRWGEWALFLNTRKHKNSYLFQSNRPDGGHPLVLKGHKQWWDFD